jgi:prepilin-type N-terminal cleavage/methylation domain-containing protein
MKNIKRSVIKRTRYGFTFIELLISLAVMAIAFLPLMRMFTGGLEQVYTIGDMDTARYLGKEGMEKLRNLNYTKAQIRDLGDVWEPPLNQPPLEINDRKWRVLRKVFKETDPLEVRILVFREPRLADSKPIVELVTLIEDLEWTAGD